jgi:hypothetical protein
MTRAVRIALTTFAVAFYLGAEMEALPYYRTKPPGEQAVHPDFCVKKRYAGGGVRTAPPRCAADA